MLKRIVIVGGAVLALSFVVSAAMGADNEPKKANKYQATGVNAYEECTSLAPTENTGGALALPACPAVDASGSACNFGDKGSAKLAAKAKDDVYLNIKVGGLENCDGTELRARATIASTTNDCTTSARCTTTTLTDFPIPGATCIVDKGKCKIKTGVNEATPGTISLNANTSIAIGAVSLFAGTTAIVRAGVLVP